MEQRLLEINEPSPSLHSELSQQNSKVQENERSEQKQQPLLSKSLPEYSQEAENEINYALHYSKWHSDSTEHQLKMMDMYEKMIKPYLPEDKNARILDVGCGMGFLMLTLKNLGYQNVTGIEISQQQVQSCLQKNLDVIHTTDTAATLQANYHLFDQIFCMDVLEHIPVDQQLTFARSIFTALKPGGKFICTVPNANSTLASRWRYIDWTHQISFTEHSIEFLLQNARFNKIQVTSVDPFIEKKTFLQHVIHKFTRWLRRMEMIAELGEEGKHIPLSLNLLVCCHKNR